LITATYTVLQGSRTSDLITHLHSAQTRYTAWTTLQYTALEKCRPTADTIRGHPPR